jgi:two-component system cell cycle sensor histidine kinase/response regulator CckA
VVAYKRICRQQTGPNGAAIIMDSNYKDIIDHAPLGIYEAELITGKLTYVNPTVQQMLGYTQEELLCLKVVDILADDSKHLFTELQSNTLSSDIQEAISEYKIKTKNGSVIPTLTNYMISSANCNPRRAVFYYQDLTKIKWLEKELWNSQKLEAIGTLAAGIAHDFNNLLTVIQGSVSILLHNLEADHPQYYLLEKMDQAAKAGADITRKLIGYARKGKYQVIPVRLNSLIIECSGLISRTRKNVIIRPELSLNLWEIHGDKEQIEQVLFNLFVNSIEAMPMGGELSIRTRNLPASDVLKSFSQAVPGDYIVLEIADTGIGMDPHTLKRIFEPFFTTKEMGRGTGLGLASVHGIVKNHNGFIDVESKEGVGTTFRVCFPAQSHPTLGVKGSGD